MAPLPIPLANGTMRRSNRATAMLSLTWTLCTPVCLPPINSSSYIAVASQPKALHYYKGKGKSEKLEAKSEENIEEKPTSKLSPIELPQPRNNGRFTGSGCYSGPAFGKSAKVATK